MSDGSFILTLDFPAYRALRRWNASALRAMRQGPPARVQWELAHPKESTPAMHFGRAVHTALIEPERFAREYVRRPDNIDYRTKDGKAWRDEHAGEEVLTGDDWSRCADVVDAVLAHPAAGRSLGATVLREATLTWQDCKARPDWIADGRIVEFKVTRHANAGEWMAHRAFADGWMHQLAWYREGARACGMDVQGGRLVLVSPTAPHFVHALEVKSDALDLIALENKRTLEAMRECEARGVWPGTPEAWRLVEPPAGAQLVDVGEEVE